MSRAPWGWTALMVFPGVRSLLVEGTMEELLSGLPTIEFAQWGHSKAVID